MAAVYGYGTPPLILGFGHAWVAALFMHAGLTQSLREHVIKISKNEESLWWLVCINLTSHGLNLISRKILPRVDRIPQILAEELILNQKSTSTSHQ